MNFSYNWLQSFFEKKLPSPEKLAQALTMHFAEVEQVEENKFSSSPFADAREVEKKQNDFVLSIDVRPNRAGDCFSHFGIAQEISAVLGYQFKKEKLLSQKTKEKKMFSVQVKDKKACSRYTIKIINDVKVDSSPKWLKQRLEVCGLKPINNIVDIANYVMLETGQPLHAFDADKIASKIIVRFSQKKEKIVTLDKNKYHFDEKVLVIADEKDVLAIAGIKGGEKAEIDEKTKTIILEAACFDPGTIRKASGKLNLKTDASLRFEHGVDPNLTEKAIVKAFNLIKEIAQGESGSDLIDFYPEKIKKRKIKINFNNVEKLLGIKISDKEIKRILESLGFKVSGQFIEIPTNRQDVCLTEDLIEEIGRIYGYWRIPALSAKSDLILPKKNENVFWQEKTRDILKEINFTEVYNYSFFSEEEEKVFNFPAQEMIKLKNPLSQEQKYLKTSLVPGILSVIEKNSRNFPQIMIFELAKIFKNSSRLIEKTMLVGAINNDDFFQLKGMINFLLNKLGVSQLSYSDFSGKNSFIYHDSRSAEIKINNELIGFLGQVCSEKLKKLNIKGKVVLFEIDFDNLLKFVCQKNQYQLISKYPAATRDISLLVPETVKAAEVLNKINKANKLIKEIDLFDIYQGKELPLGKKNLAFRITYQAENKTLTSAEIDNQQNKIINLLEDNPEWSVRK
jgi:phenylalanyl-tRNA synthetase beta chain